ncbi:hypothetical protein GCM10027275_49810 [Rhabdobacter roseus]|uniref:Nucleotidyltransferase n=1 Tax=Rhabdobacter roseus TaxID=1655419 RepID=A0A840TUX2_9BACT|nr:hypothetical protein [Rhabdobacter roseus]MBB5287044.1 hypothetical protein [Rhabdobacter roseus]
MMNERIVKTTLKGAAIGGGTFLVADLIGQVLSMRQAGYEVTWDNLKAHYQTNQALNHAILGVCLGGSAGFLGSVLAYENNAGSQRFNQNDFLDEILVKSKLDLKNKLTRFDLAAVQKVCDFLSIALASKLIGKPIRTGSVAKRTAVNSVSDYDVAFVVKPGSGTMEQLHELFFDTLREKFEGPGCTVRQQNYTVGVLVDRPDGTLLRVDVMPTRGRDNYAETGDLTIWSQRNRKHQKTNVGKHNQLPVGQPQVRDAIRLLKTYKLANNLNLPTALINQIVPMALKKRGGQSSRAANLRFCMEYLADKLSNQTVQDVANGNNNLMASLSERSKYRLRARLLDDLERWNENPPFLMTMFADMD